MSNEVMPVFHIHLSKNYYILHIQPRNPLKDFHTMVEALMVEQILNQRKLLYFH